MGAINQRFPCNFTSFHHQCAFCLFFSRKNFFNVNTNSNNKSLEMSDRGDIGQEDEEVISFLRFLFFLFSSLVKKYQCNYRPWQPQVSRLISRSIETRDQKIRRKKIERARGAHRVMIARAFVRLSKGRGKKKSGGKWSRESAEASLAIDTSRGDFY